MGKGPGSVSWNESLSLIPNVHVTISDAAAMDKKNYQCESDAKIEECKQNTGNGTTSCCNGFLGYEFEFCCTEEEYNELVESYEDVGAAIGKAAG